MFRILLAILISISPTLGYAQTTSKTLGGNYPSGFSGFRNYAKNPGGEIDAQNVSVAGTNGTIGVFSNNPITNKKSFRVGGDLNTNITATFNFDTFDQGLADSSNNCAAALNLQPNGVGTYTINVKLGSTTVATKSFTTTSGLPVQYHTFVFSCGVLGQVPTIDVVANLTSGSGTDHFQADDFYMGQDPGFVQSMAVRTQPAAYTPALVAFGTSPTVTCMWSQDGSFLDLNCKATAGSSPASSAAQWPLPTGYTIATGHTNVSIGAFFVQTPGGTAANYGGSVLINSGNSYLQFSSKDIITNSAGNEVPLTPQNGNLVVAASDLISFTVRVPIAGASNINATNSLCLQDGSCVNVLSAKVSNTGVVTDNSYSLFSGSCVWSPTGTASCPVASGKFSVVPNCVANAQNDASNRVNYQPASSSVTSLVFQAMSGASLTTAANTAFTVVCNRAGADVKPVMQAPWVSGSVTSNAAVPTRHEWARVVGGNPPTIGQVSTAGWLTYSSRTGAGDYTFTHNFGTQVECSISAVISASRRFVRFQTLNTTTIRVTIEDSAGTGQDTDFSLICDGFRP